jgi:hydroxyacylglutathione hydrolase
LEIVSGIHLIDNIRGGNSYLVIIESKMLLVDCGMPGNGKRIVQYVKNLGRDPADISQIAFTHADIDHVGSAADLKKMTGAKLAIHADDAPILAGKSRFKTINGPVGVIFRLVLPLLRFHPVEADILLQDKSEIGGFQVIYTPGHSRGSICLYQPGKLIFAGDAIYKRFAVDQPQARASKELISTLDFDIMLPGHGALIIGHASDGFRKRLEQL